MSNADNHRLLLKPISVANLKLVRDVNAVIFPVRYSEKFYRELPTLGEYALLAYWDGKCVGTVCCRRVHLQDENKQTLPIYHLYMMTLGVLAPYRSMGIGTAMVEHILRNARADQHCKSIYLHVQTVNTDAISFYERRGLTIQEMVTNYYDIDPPDAYVLQMFL